MLAGQVWRSIATAEPSPAAREPHTYRSRYIHEFPFDADERFFKERGLYASTRYHAWDSTRFLELSVSARWLINLYRVTVERYEQSLLARRKLPINLWTELCDTSSEFGYTVLPEQTMNNGEGRRTRINVDIDGTPVEQFDMPHQV